MIASGCHSINAWGQVSSPRARGRMRDALLSLSPLLTGTRFTAEHSRTGASGSGCLTGSSRGHHGARPGHASHLRRAGLAGCPSSGRAAPRERGRSGWRVCSAPRGCPVGVGISAVPVAEMVANPGLPGRPGAAARWRPPARLGPSGARQAARSGCGGRSSAVQHQHCRSQLGRAPPQQECARG